MKTPAQAAALYKIKLYWMCEHCDAAHPWPEQKARKYCDRNCQVRAYRKRKRLLQTQAQ